MSKNETEWGELYSAHDIFADEDDPRHGDVWKWVQDLQAAENLTARDVFRLSCLIGCLLGESTKPCGDTDLVADNAEGWQKVGFLEEKLRQANETIEAINSHLPKYQAALTDNAKLREALGRIRDDRTELEDRSDYARGWNDARFRLKSIASQALAQQDTTDAN